MRQLSSINDSLYKIWSWCERNSWVMLMLAFMPAAAKSVNYAYYYYFEDNNPWMTVLYYYVGYDTGFGGRKLLGTLCNQLTENLDRLMLVGILSMAINIVMFVLLTLFAYRAIHKNQNRNIPLMVLLVFCLSPFSLVEFAEVGLSSYFIETYQFAITLGWLLLFVHYHDKWWMHIVTFIAATICVLLHHTFCCTIFPLYVALFVFDSFDTDGKIKWQRCIPYIGICFLIATLLFVIWEWSNMNIGIEDMVARLKGHVGKAGDEEWLPIWLDAYYYATNTENHQSSMNIILNCRIPEIPFYLILSSPLLAFFYYPWVSAARRVKDGLAWRYRMSYVILTLLSIPIFFVAYDYSRWLVGWGFSLFSMTMTACIMDDKEIQNALQRLFAFFYRHSWIAILGIIYVSQLNLNGFEGLDQAIRLRKFFFKVMGLEVMP